MYITVYPIAAGCNTKSMKEGYVETAMDRLELYSSGKIRSTALPSSSR